jgi:hypothetical protein
MISNLVINQDRQHGLPKEGGEFKALDLHFYKNKKEKKKKGGVYAKPGPPFQLSI